MSDYQPFGGSSGEPVRTGEPIDATSPVGAFFLGGSGNGSDNGTGDRDSAGIGFDESIHAGIDKRNADGTWRKKRGRKAGSGANSSATRSRSKADYTASVESLARVLGYLHLGIAAATKTPELALSDDESNALAGATARVLEEFDIRPDPKIEAIVGLFTVAGGIYAPKIYFIRQRKKNERES